MNPEVQFDGDVVLVGHETVAKVCAVGNTFLLLFGDEK